MTTAGLLATWLAATVAADPLTGWIADRAVQIEFAFGLDQNPPSAEE